MKMITMESLAAEAYDSRQLISDLFHQLSQPVTSLCCSLELALLQTSTVKQYAEIVSRTFSEAQKASWLASALRELFNASQAGEDGEVLELRQAVGHAVDDLRPVAESAGVQVHYVALSACPVWFDAKRLRQGLFHLLGFMLGSRGRGAELTIALEQREAQSVLNLTVSGPEEGGDTTDGGPDPEHLPRELMRRFELGLARTIFEATGADFSVERGPEGISVEVRLRRAGSHRDQELVKLALDSA